MRIKTILIALVAMMLFAVQGYAQRENREARRSQTEQRRSSSKSNRGSSYQYSGSREKNTTRATPPKAQDRQISTPQRSADRTRVASSPQRSADRTRVASSPQRTNNRVNQTPSTRSYQRDRGYNVSHGGYRPIYNHHKSYYHHHHRCIFDNWYWYSYGNYHNRFIRHSLYHNRFFDSVLGYYLWGALETPTRIDLGNLSITRYNGRLKIFTGHKTSYLDLYRHQKVVYKVGYTTVEITTLHGYANIYFYDEYGNTATYRL